MKLRWHMTAHSGASRSPGFQATHALVISSDEPLIIEVTYEVEMVNPTGPWQAQVYTTSSSDSDWYGPNGTTTAKAPVRPGASYRLQYAGDKSWWDTFKAQWDNAVETTASIADGVYRVTAIVSTSNAVSLAALTSSAYLSLTGAQP
jgi:hypothetical protein